MTKENQTTAQESNPKMEDLEALESLKKKMFKYARDLQFEKAALVRDKLTEIEDRLEDQNKLI